MNAARKNIMLGTAGHVDHGKSALVKLLTGCETDTLAEEKERGLTIDLGFAPCRLADARIVGVVDVPGHVDFIRNMVAGAHGIDVAILVVAADDGIMPQTLEHLHILSLMGLRHGLVALTKIDLVDSERRASVAHEVRQLLTGTFLAQAPLCPLSNLTGEGFQEFFEALNTSVNACCDRPTTGLFRVWVDDAFSIRGAGTVITGIPLTGEVRLNDRLTLQPMGSAGRVRRMQVYGTDAQSGRAGECVALNVPELDYQQARRGMVLSAGEPCESISMAEAELETLLSLRGVIKDSLEIQLHLGTAATPAHVAMLEFGEMTAGQRQMVQLRMPEPLPIVPGERFVIRANLGTGLGGLTTIGGGRILGTTGHRLRRKKQWTLDLLAARRLAIDSPERWCELMVRESSHPIRRKEVARLCHLREDEVTSHLNNLCEQGSITTTPAGAFLHVHTIDEARAKITATVGAFHSANPQAAGICPEDLLRSTELDEEVFDLTTEVLLKQKELARDGTVFCQPGWRTRLPDPDAQLCQAIATFFRQARWTPPTAVELAPRLNRSAQKIERLISLLIDRGTLVRLDDRVNMHSDAVAAAQIVVLDLFRTKATFSTMQFRDALGVSRKFAVPLLDHLDKLRFTVRSGHDRTPGAEARRLLAKV